MLDRGRETVVHQKPEIQTVILPQKTLRHHDDIPLSAVTTLHRVLHKVPTLWGLRFLSLPLLRQIKVWALLRIVI